MEQNKKHMKTISHNILKTRLGVVGSLFLKIQNMMEKILPHNGFLNMIIDVY